MLIPVKELTSFVVSMITDTTLSFAGNHIANLTGLETLTGLSLINLDYQTIMLPPVRWQAELIVENNVFGPNAYRVPTLAMQQGGTYISPNIVWDLSADTGVRTYVDYTFDSDLSPIGSASVNFSGRVTQALLDEFNLTYNYNNTRIRAVL